MTGNETSTRLARLRLVKVLVQPVFVVEEPDGTLSEPDHVVTPVAVKACEWPTYATDTFPDHVEQLEQQLFGPRGRT